MKRLLIATYIIGALTILQPGEPTTYVYTDRKGDFTAITPGKSTAYGYNQGGGVTTVIRPGEPNAYIYQDRKSKDWVPGSSLIETERMHELGVDRRR